MRKAIIAITGAIALLICAGDAEAAKNKWEVLLCSKWASGLLQ
jgi:hypothetical protein